MSDPLPRWYSRTTFVLALSASAVGLGNLWRFAWLTGEHGGGAFMLTYVLCLVFVAVPLMIAEVLIGKHGRGSPLTSLRLVADRSLLRHGWVGLGILSGITGLLVLACHVVVAGWALAYMELMQGGTLAAASAEGVAAHFSELLADGPRQLYWQSLFLAAVAGVIVLGIRNGLGIFVWLAVPLMLLLLAALVKFAYDNGDLEATREFIFTIKLVDFDRGAVLAGLGHAFFTLGIGVGTGYAYGAYAHQRTPLGRSVLAVAVFDTVIGLLVAIAIFPLVFASNLEPAVGPGLVFLNLPYAFGNILQGEMFGTVFFGLLALAALARAVAILEPLVTSLMLALGLSRLVAVMLAGMAVWLLALAVSSSLAAVPVLPWSGNGNLLRLFDALGANVLVPLVSLGTVVLVGWRLRPEIIRVHLYRESALFFSLWRVCLRYIAPLAIAILLVAAVSESTM